MPDVLKLVVNGTEFTGWQSVQIVRSLFNASGAFTLTASDRWPGSPKSWGIRMGDSCQILINKTAVITGFIEDINLTSDDKNHSVSFSGRDTLCDLIDCSYEGPNQYKGLTVSQLIETLCDAFNIKVSYQVFSDDGLNVLGVVEESFTIDQGQSVFEAIGKLCRKYGLLPVSYGDGLLTITTAGNLRSFESLQEGTNIKASSLIQSNRERFSRYVVKGTSNGSDNKQPEESASPENHVTDSVINRYRPLVILSEHGTDTGYAKQRAQFEANVRAGKSRAIEAVVQGWTQQSGQIWNINRITDVLIESMGINEPLLISDITYTLDTSGSLTKMKLVHPAIFSTEPAVIKTGFDPLKDKTVIQPKRDGRR